MTRKQRTFIAVAAALLTLGITWSTAVAAPQRPPRQPDTQRTEQRDTGCVLSRYPSPNNCRAELRPTPRPEQQRGR